MGISANLRVPTSGAASPPAARVSTICVVQKTDWRSRWVCWLRGTGFRPVARSQQTIVVYGTTFSDRHPLLWHAAIQPEGQPQNLQVAFQPVMFPIPQLNVEEGTENSPLP